MSSRMGHRPESRVNNHDDDEADGQSASQRPQSRMSILRDVATPLFRRPSTVSDAASLRSLTGLFKRKRDEEEGDGEMMPPPLPGRVPVRLNFLFVGAQGSGQTSLLL